MDILSIDDNLADQLLHTFKNSVTIQPYTTEKVISQNVDPSLSKHEYLRLREDSKNQAADLYSAYKEV